MIRTVAVEALDHLPTDDPAAMRSRLDLQRIHRFMGTRQRLVQALRKFAGTLDAKRPLRVLELGAGDGSLMLAVARSLGAGFPAVDLTLLDRQALVSQAAIASYAELGWQARLVTVDVLDWTADAARVDGHITADTDWDAVVTSLFLHHFEGPPLAALLRKVAGCSRFFVACEPRRAGLALAASRLVGLIGANAVTRQDAVLSVHAGFADQELSGLWPQPHASWSLREGPAGLFSHSFEAERLSAMGHGTH